LSEFRQARVGTPPTPFIKVEIRRKLSLLTLAPNNWTNRKISEYFCVSKYDVAKERSNKDKYGMLSDPPSEKNRKGQFTDADKQHITEFYTSDEYSQQLPEMKNVISVKQSNGKRIKIQKRLLFVNINELHSDLKKKLKDAVDVKTIGLSVFVDQRPKHVITVGASGTHSVCVCIYHQNVKLMLSGIGLYDDRHLLMDKVVCSVYNRDCMMSRCSKYI
jgi:hypothetical protein